MAEHGLTISVVARPASSALDCDGEYEWELYDLESGRRLYGYSGSPEAAERDVRRWTKGAYARDAQYVPCEPQDASACQYCLIGALALASDGRRTVFCAAESALCALLPPSVGGLAPWNDYHARSHADVLSLLDRAIETLEAGYPHGVTS